MSKRAWLNPHSPSAVRDILENWVEFNALTLSGEALNLRIDVRRALTNASFSDQEDRLAGLINAGSILERAHAEWEIDQDIEIDIPDTDHYVKSKRRNRNPGRPRGSTSFLVSLALKLVRTTESESARRAEASRLVQGLIRKIENYLGRGYGTQT